MPSVIWLSVGSIQRRDVMVDADAKMQTFLAQHYVNAMEIVKGIFRGQPKVDIKCFCLIPFLLVDSHAHFFM